MSIRIHLAGFRRAEDGTVAILWAMSLVVVFGFVALAFDIGRVGATQSELQSFADNVALAAAGELDGKDDAITRANAAAANLISDSQTFGNGGQALAGAVDYALTFYSALPTSDTAPLTTVTTNPALAVFAGVVVTPRTVSTTFRAAANAMLGGAGGGSATVGAAAVAGRTLEACDISPFMFCLPSADYGSDPSTAIGDMIFLRSGGGPGAGWGPGNFGFVDISLADTGGVCAGQGNIERCQIAAELTITQCYSQRGVDLQPGQRHGLRDHINVRFDRYSSPLSPEAIYPAAPNIVSGTIADKGEACIKNKTTASGAVPLPRDTCIAAGTCTPHQRIGNGVYSMNEYMDKNHGDADGDYSDGDGTHLSAYSYAVPAGLASTRYATYLKEIAWSGDAANNPSGDILRPGVAPETGLPRCSPHVSSDPERRVFIAAGIDCVGNAINGAKKDVPVERYFKLFLTQPVDGSGQDADIFAEVIGIEALDGYTSAGSGGIFRDVVQLYR